MIDMTEDAEAEFGILVQHLALGHVVAEMRRDEILVLQQLLNQGADLLAPLDTRIFLENPVAFRGKLLEAVPHLTAPLWLLHGAIDARSYAEPASIRKAAGIGCLDFASLRAAVCLQKFAVSQPGRPC